MRSKSVTVVLDAPRTEVFEFLARVENMPALDTGVIDMLAGPEPDDLALFPTRVVPLPGDRSAFTFTTFQAPEMTDELFESQHASLLRELAGLRERFATAA